MSFTFRPAKREDVSLLIGLAGGTGSGKTMSALLLARGLAQGQPFHLIDTENGRAKHYADDFDFLHGELHAPFRPSRYAEAIEAAEKAGARVIVVDSMSHEWTGEGGCLDWQEEEMGGREANRLLSWQKPKRDHRKMVTRLLQVKAHVILCFRASERVEMVDDPDKPGKKMVVPKRSLTGLDGWIPDSEPRLPYELTASFLLVADRPGVPRPIKLQEQHRPFFPLDRPISEAAGVALGEWAAGGVAEPRSGIEQGGNRDGPTAERAVVPTPLAGGSEPQPGSVTPWAQLRKLAADSGIPRDVLADVGGQMFPGRAPSTLSEDETVALWNAVGERVEAGVDA